MTLKEKIEKEIAKKIMIQKIYDVSNDISKDSINNLELLDSLYNFITFFRVYQFLYPVPFEKIDSSIEDIDTVPLTNFFLNRDKGVKHFFDISNSLDFKKHFNNVIRLIDSIKIE